MKEYTRQLLDKAERAIQAAHILLEAGNFFDFSSGRAYYAMFFTATDWKAVG